MSEADIMLSSMDGEESKVVWEKLTYILFKEKVDAAKSDAESQAPDPKFLLDLLELDQRVCKKYIESLSNMAFVMDAPVKTLNESNTRSASDLHQVKRELMLDHLKSGFPISF